LLKSIDKNLFCLSVSETKKKVSRDADLVVGLVVAVGDPEQFRRDVPALLLGQVKLLSESVGLPLPVADDLVELTNPFLHLEKAVL
jgi:hypothetical protein